tara:strand:+ start:609 stop:1985 length:1377 start_codon:yes stop_codon:yes gene_type:complete
MTTTIVSIGSNQNIDTAVPNTLVSGSGPEYTITWNKTLSSDVAVGDLATATDVPDGAYVYLITAISGSNYTLKYCTGAGGDQSPTALCSDAYCTSKPTFTFKRAFSLISDFEVMVEDATPDYWGTTDDVIGECHADSATFDENNLFFNNKQSLSSVTLSVYEDDRHDGVAGNGVVLQPESGGTHDHGIIKINIDNMTVEWLDINLGELDSNPTNKAIVLVGTNNNNIIRNNLIHDKGGNPGGNGPFMIHMVGTGASSDSLYIFNNIIYNIVETGNDHSTAIVTNAWAGNAYIYNNTVYNLKSNGTSKHAIAFRFGNPASSNTRIKNNIASKLDSQNSTGERAYEHGGNNGGAGTVDEAYNLSDDTASTAYEADGTGSLIDKTLAEIAFVSISPGSEDLHIEDSSVCYEAGVDLGTTNEVNIDINGFDRDAGDVTWDMGAHQVSRADTGNPAFLMFLDI